MADIKGALALTDDDKFQCEMCRELTQWRQLDCFMLEAQASDPHIKHEPLNGSYPPSGCKLICNRCLGLIMDVGSSRYWAQRA